MISYSTTWVIIAFFFGVSLDFGDARGVDPRLNARLCAIVVVIERFDAVLLHRNEDVAKSGLQCVCTMAHPRQGRASSVRGTVAMLRGS